MTFFYFNPYILILQFLVPNSINILVISVKPPMKIA